MSLAFFLVSIFAFFTYYNGKCLVVRLNNAAFSYIRSSYVSSIIDVARTVFTKAKFA